MTAAVAKWPAHWREEWEERAAIMEYLGGDDRETAERRAYGVVKRRMEEIG